MDRTIAAISTGQAPGGIGVVRVSGPEAIPIAQRVFRARSGAALHELAGYTAAYGEVFDRNGEKVDDCVALVFKGPRSYTGEDVVELSCHGGLVLTRQVLDAVLSAGASPAGPGEFTRQAFVNGKLDLAQAEAVMELIGARGRQAARIAQAGSSGVLSRKVEELVGRLEELASHLAAWADFPEEDVEEVTGGEVEAVLAYGLVECRNLLKGFDRGQLFREGVRTVIAGRPNVGKSTLMNLLAGRERSIVTPYPGTTRDVVEEQVSLGGVPLLLADTAGLRDASDPVEEIGIASAREQVAAAQLVLAVFDGSRELDEDDKRFIDSLGEVPAVAVVNKADLPGKLEVSEIEKRFSAVVKLSAMQGTGVAELEQVVLKILGAEGGDLTGGELFTQRQKLAVVRAQEALTGGQEALQLGMTLDAVTVCVEDALSALFELTGKKVSDQVVDRVFEQFCVGK